MDAKNAVLREFDAEYQLDVVRLLFKHSKFCDDMRVHLRDEHLDLPVARWLARAILDYHYAYKLQPTQRALRSTLAAALEADEVESVVAVAIKSFIKHEITKNVPDEAHVMDLAKNFVAAQKQTELAARLLEAIEKGDVNLAQSVFAEGSSVSANFGATSVNYVEDTERAIEERKNAEYSVIPTGIEVIDQHFRHKGPERKCACLCIAATGVGKSAVTVVMATNAVKLGYKVAIIILESTKTDLRLRLDQAFTHKTADEIEAKPSLVRKIAAKLKQDFNSPLHYERFQPGSLTPNGVRSWLNYLSATENFVPDLLLIDSVDDITADPSAYTGSLYLDQGAVMTEMCNIAEDYNLVLWGTAQGNREALDAENLRLSMLGDSIKKAQRVRCVLAVQQTFQESLLDPPVGRLTLLKNSWGRKNLTETVLLDWARQRILV